MAAEKTTATAPAPGLREHVAGEVKRLEGLIVDLNRAADAALGRANAAFNKAEAVSEAASTALSRANVAFNKAEVAHKAATKDEETQA